MSGTAIVLLVVGLLLIGIASTITAVVVSNSAWERYLDRLEVEDRIFKSRWE